MIKKAIRMKLFEGQEAEYTKRHQELWPEMRQMLKEHGALSYSIFLDRQTNELFGYLEIEDEQTWQKVSKTAINQKWWTYMKDLMETNSDHSPVTEELVHVFEL
ncbi:L-rhamnose mutarotase [Enterococcus florum]|uniref:L-rhamnose mutarotase n=1 Tax=Enterococcus florum TaxID=2480627 RepID=A0A4P5PFV4_9ENTE|nr:L-rhamnose mutarotase [Enterococcus florum]GCF95301.1 L-rhamnose mutarotase [Enterococcus florum]